MKITLKSLIAWGRNRIYFLAILVLLAWLAGWVWKMGIDLAANIADVPYHLAVSSAFARSGGIATWDFWESLSLGRAHNYPPLFHTIFANFLKAGLSPVDTGKLMIELTIIGGLAVYCWGISKLFSIKVAFLSVFFLASSFAFIRISAILLPSTGVMFLSPVLFYAFKERRWLAYIALLTLMLYMHLFMPFIILAGFFLYCVCCERKTFWIWFEMTAIAFLLYSPWLVHVLLGGFSYIKYFDSTASLSDWWRVPIINIFIYLFAIVGLIIFIKKDKVKQTGPERFFWLLSLVFLGIVFVSGNRIVDGHLLVIQSIMAALALVALSRTRFLKGAFAFMVIIFCCFDTPYFTFPNGHFRFILQKTSFAESINPGAHTVFRQNDYLYVGNLIRENTHPGESVFSMTELYNDPLLNRESQTTPANAWAIQANLSILNMRQPENRHRPPVDVARAKILVTSTPLSEINPQVLEAYGAVANEEAVRAIQSVFKPLSYCYYYSRQKAYFYVNTRSDTIMETKGKTRLPLFLADALTFLLVAVFLWDIRKAGKSVN